MTTVLYRGPGTQYRRRKPLLADHRIVVNGKPYDKGEAVPGEGIPARDKDNLVAHGYLDPQSTERSYSH